MEELQLFLDSDEGLRFIKEKKVRINPLTGTIVASYEDYCAFLRELIDKKLINKC